LFDEEDSKFSHQSKLAKRQWIQDPNQSNTDNLNDVRHVRYKPLSDEEDS